MNETNRDEKAVAEDQSAPQSTLDADAKVEAQMKARSRRSFLWGALAVGTSYGGLNWLKTRRMEDGIPWPLRRVLQTNESLARDFFDTSRLAPTFAASRIDPLRANGDVGLDADFDVAQWELTVDGLAGEQEMQTVTLAQIKALPRAEMITELKCIEGWATVVRWTGARLVDFMARYPPPTQSGKAFNAANAADLPGYIGLATPDGAYYVGLEMAAALHPQTLLCYAMNGQALTLEHGAPLRLAIPVKYGIKNLKRIGTLTYTNQRPADYWAERGYDYHAGH